MRQRRRARSSGGPAAIDGAERWPPPRSEVLLIGGRSGVGKTSAAAALHELLVRRDVSHAVIEGDLLDLAHPMPHQAFPARRLAEDNLHHLWRNYRELGHHRLVYTNTVAVLEAEGLAGAMGDDPLVVPVLLRADDGTAARRLGHRAGGEPWPDELTRSARSAAHLDAAASDSVRRIDTAHLTAVEVAERLLDLVGWAR